VSIREKFGAPEKKRNQCNSFGRNGGDDETRTRDLCRDRAEF
jgi:hypothetical protein